METKQQQQQVTSHEISGARLMVEIKTVKKRLEKVLDNNTFIDQQKHDEKKGVGKRIQSQWQRVSDLMQRFQNLKFAQLQHNNTATINMNNQTYTIAQALAMKEHIIGLKEQVLDKLKRDRLDVERSMERSNSRMESNLQDLLRTSFQSSTNNNVNHNDTIAQISNSFRSSNQVHKIDPIGIDNRIEELENEIENFRREIDFKLSEVNAITKVFVAPN